MNDSLKKIINKVPWNPKFWSFCSLSCWMEISHSYSNKASIILKIFAKNDHLNAEIIFHFTKIIEVFLTFLMR